MYFLRLARQRDKCQHSKYFLISPWQVYAAIVQSLSRRLKPAVMAPFILAVGPGSGEKGPTGLLPFYFGETHPKAQTHTGFSHLSQNKWAAPHSSLCPLRPSKMDKGAAWRLRQPSFPHQWSAVRCSCSWWNTPKRDATAVAEQRLPADERMAAGTPVSSQMSMWWW